MTNKLTKAVIALLAVFFVMMIVSIILIVQVNADVAANREQINANSTRIDDIQNLDDRPYEEES